MKTSVYNQEGKVIEEAQLSDGVFGVKLSNDLVHQVVVSQAANRRQGNAHTKGRSEVSGGGRKPWRQKGTGRARHGSIRSPLWKGGGVTFGPTNEKVYKKTIPAGMRRAALLMVLSAKAKNNLLVMLDELKITERKTKQVFQVLKRLPCQNGSVLIVLPDYNKDLIVAARNIPKVATMQAKDINALDLLSFKYLLITKQTEEVLRKIFT